MEKKINRFMSKEVDLGREPVKHLLFILAVPAITSQVVNALYNMVDRMYIGHIEDVGSEALTGVGICFPIIMIISAFAYLVGMGGAPRASIFMGKGDKDSAERILGNCFFCSHSCGIVANRCYFDLFRAAIIFVRSQRKHHRICQRLHGYIRGRYHIRAGDFGS